MRGPIHDQYFGYRPVDGHRPDCSVPGLRPRSKDLPGSDVWTVSVLRRTRYATINGDAAEVEEITVRLLCRTCGTVIFFGDGFDEHTTVTQIGYGSKPERCGGLWLHPGPPILQSDPENLGPGAYYVTASPRPPASETDVLGLISQGFTARRALRFTAAYGQRPGGGAITNTDEFFKTKTAAVKWIISEHARQLEHGEEAK